MGRRSERVCAVCGAELRPGDGACGACGAEAPPPPGLGSPDPPYHTQDPPPGVVRDGRRAAGRGALTALACLLLAGCSLVTHRAPSDFFLDASVPAGLQPTVRAGLSRAFDSLRLREVPPGDALVVSAGACGEPDFAGQVELGSAFNAFTLCGWGTEVSTPADRAWRILALHHAVGHVLGAGHLAGDAVMAPAPSPGRIADLLRDEDHFRYTEADLRDVCARSAVPACG